MTQIERLIKDIQTDRAHLCNRCLNRDYGRLQPRHTSPHARFECGITPAVDRIMRRDKGAVRMCTEFLNEAQQICQHLPGDMANALPGFDCELGTDCTCVRVEEVGV